MKGVKGAKRTPNEAVIVVFKPRTAMIGAEVDASYGQR